MRARASKIRLVNGQWFTLFYNMTAYAAREIRRREPYRAAPAEVIVWTLAGVLLMDMRSSFIERNALAGRVLQPAGPLADVFTTKVLDRGVEPSHESDPLSATLTHP
jgi:hypothetical protein